MEIVEGYFIWSFWSKASSESGSVLISFLCDSVKSRCLCGEAFSEDFHHRDTEDTQRHGKDVQLRTLPRIVRAFGAVYLTGLLTPEHLGAER
jgi:hypothetical protein